ncbi:MULTISPECIES: hypothetical protein [Burkholderia]|uniref:hypothetical protein n=1 Tax=Burkholderia TaxID=32008 RepID=UPI0011810449|nr:MULTISPECIES: hypothetical protein [Burkholderia]
MNTQRLSVDVLPYMMKAIEQKMLKDGQSKRALVEEALDQYLNLSGKKDPIKNIEESINLLSLGNQDINQMKDDLAKYKEALYTLNSNMRAVIDAVKSISPQQKN